MSGSTITTPRGVPQVVYDVAWMQRNKWLPVALMLGVVWGGAAMAQDAGLPAGTIQQPVEKQQWVDAPHLAPGVRILVLEGNPKAEGMFTIRLRIPAGTRLQPHWHPRDERVTILSGLAKVGFGDAWKEEGMTSYAAGSFYLNPPMSHHYVWIVEDTEMQLTGMGPWELHYLED